MIPMAFEYHRAASVEEAIRLLEQYGPDAKVLAGGHSLTPLMKLRFAQPAHVIDIGRLHELRYIREEGNVIAIGALTLHRTVAESATVRQRIPVLAEAAFRIGDVQVRNMGTIGGSLAHADPAADYPAVVLALEAEIVAQGPAGRRTIRARDFFRGPFTTALQPNELIVEVRVPVPSGKTGSAYQKYPHPASGFAVVGCAAVLTVDAETCRDVRVAFTGVATQPFRDTVVEDALRGQRADEATVRAAAEKAAEGVQPLGDAFASAEYRRHMAKVYARRALLQALTRAT
ncbi:MAG: xanthine dehydrogenase family protein subunit M [Acidobacteria bacterium]|nr:xanthine dehydrogenase family protein subunit M [Acidobacteriota bacterium]MDW7984287.1 xanthine dehydrogenase family protein subunit M [Acidobacteriota bacterium]